MQPLWCAAVTPESGRPLPLRSAAVSDGRGRLAVPMQDRLVCLLDDADGPRVLWEYSAGAAIVGRPGLHTDGSLRVHSQDGRLHGVSAWGRLLWPAVNVGRPLSWSSPRVDCDGNTWICSYSGGVVKVDSRGGVSRRAFFSSPTRLDCLGVLQNGALIVGGEDHFLHCIDLEGERGAERWDQSADRGRTGWYINAPLAMASGGVVVVAGGDQKLYGFGDEGSCCWETALPGLALGGPVVDAQDRIYVGLSRGVPGETPTGALACFDSRAEKWLWEIGTAGAVESTPVIGSDGTVYAGDNAGWIYAVRDGRILQQERVGYRPVRSAGTLIGAGRLAFGDDEGRLIVLDCDSPGLAEGWPQAGGACGWSVPADDAAVDASAEEASSFRTVIQAPFVVVEEPTATVVEAPAAKAEPTPRASRRLKNSSGLRADQAVFQQPACGELGTVIDFRTGDDLLRLHPYPWCVGGNGERSEHAFYLTNSGPGELWLSVGCRGQGASVSPGGKLRIRPGGGTFIVLRLDADADEWVLLTVQVYGNGRRPLKLRLRRGGEVVSS